MSGWVRFEDLTLTEVTKKLKPSRKIGKFSFLVLIYYLMSELVSNLKEQIESQIFI